MCERVKGIHTCAFVQCMCVETLRVCAAAPVCLGEGEQRG